MSIRRLFLRLTRPVTRLLNRINIRIGRPPLTGEMYQEALRHLESGDIVLTRTAWRPTNLFIPGKWSHAVLVVDPVVGLLVEATLPQAQLTSMVDVWAACSEVKIVRPKFLSQDERAEAATIAATLIGTPYDLDFSSGESELYCSELIMLALRSGTPNPLPLIGSRVYGEHMVVPDDFDDPSLFDLVFDGSR